MSWATPVKRSRINRWTCCSPPVGEGVVRSWSRNCRASRSSGMGCLFTVSRKTRAGAGEAYPELWLGTNSLPAFGAPRIQVPSGRRLRSEDRTMFGNLKGWIVSALIVFSVVVFFVWTGALTVPPVSQPSGKIKFSEKIELPVDPKPFLPTGTKDRNAGELYRLAINEYENNEKLYGPGETYAKTPAAMVDANPKGVQYILEAASCKNFDLFASRPDEVVHYNATWPDLTALERMGMHTIVAGVTYRNRKDLDNAETYIKAAFVLGYRLYSE